VQSEADDGQGHDGDEDKGDDREHGDRSPFIGSGCADVSRLPPPVARVDRDQPWFDPEMHPGSIKGQPWPYGLQNSVVGAGRGFLRGGPGT
jgi:hypothetical protein